MSSISRRSQIGRPSLSHRLSEADPFNLGPVRHMEMPRVEAYEQQGHGMKQQIAIYENEIHNIDKVDIILLNILKRLEDQSMSIERENDGLGKGTEALRDISQEIERKIEKLHTKRVKYYRRLDALHHDMELSFRLASESKR